MSDVAQFLSSYNKMLDDALDRAGLPADLQAQYRFESCIVQKPDKELYVVTRKGDGMRGMLRISRDESPASAVAEATVLYYLNHPAIPKVMGLWQQHGRNFLVREYFEGRTLEEVVKEDGTLPAGDIMAIGYKIAAVLQYLHSQTPPVIHRDIKPGNIILTPNGDIKLIDFDIARSVQEDGQHDTVYLGTRDYAAPEQYGYAQTGPATDIYALGMVMLYLATGRTDRRELKNKVLDTDLRGLIEKCTAFDPQARFSSAAQVMRYIKRRRRKMWRRIGLAAAAVLVSAVMIFGAYLLGNRQGQRQGYEQGYTDGNEAALENAGSGEQGPGAPLNTNNGNIFGNIICGGLAVQNSHGEDAYFIAQDVVFLVTDGGETLIPLAIVDGIRFLNVYDGDIYGMTETAIVRIDPQTGETQEVLNIRAESLIIIDGRMYFKNKADFLTLYSADLNGENLIKHNDLKETYYLNIYGDRLYFSYGPQGRKLYSCNIDGSDLVLLHDGEVNWVNVYDGYIYYNVYSSPAGLYRMPVSGEEGELLYAMTSSYTNVTPWGIFCSDDRTKALYWLSLDGSDSRQLSANAALNICVIDGWVFYVNRDDGALWMVRLDGTDDRKLMAWSMEDED